MAKPAEHWTAADPRTAARFLRRVRVVTCPTPNGGRELAYFIALRTGAELRVCIPAEDDAADDAGRASKERTTVRPRS
jgi:hypothetical protein